MKNKKNYHSLQLTLKEPDGRKIDHLISLKKKNHKSYFNAQHLLFKLNPLERSFYEYLIEKADLKSRVFIDINLKKEYLDFVDKVIGADVARATAAKVDQVVPKLKELGLIISSNDRGLYYINPKYAHKGSEKSRLLNLMNIIHERIMQKLPINMLTDVSDEKLDAK
jgi:hypothetical protein